MSKGKGWRYYLKETLNKLGELTNSWSVFIYVILKPYNLLLISLTVYLVYLTSSGSMSQKLPENIDIFSTIITALVSAVTGAMVARELIKEIEEGVLVTRGKSAIRGLKVILLNVQRLEGRVQSHHDSIGDGNKRIKQSYDEIKDRCNILSEEILNAIEEWKDIIPEADISEKVGIITDLKAEMDRLRSQINKLEKEKDESDEMREELESEIKDKEEELKDVKRRLEKERQELNKSIGTGTFTPGNAFAGSINPENICSNCGKSYLEEDLDNGNCPNCGVPPNTIILKS